MKQKKEEQPDIVFGIEARAFLKKQLHTVRWIWTVIHGRTLSLTTPNEKDVISGFPQCQARLVDTLVCHQIINNRYYYSLQDYLQIIWSKLQLLNAQKWKKSIFGKTFHDLETHYSLKQYNSFGFDVIADHFVEIDTFKALQKLIKDKFFINSKHLIISGGNNILFCSDRYEGLVIHINTKGIETVSEDSESVIIRAQAGEDWSDFVKHIVSRNLFGIENLAHIPGKVGAAPVQNIGAYGMELKDAFMQCEAMSTLDGSIRVFSKDECKFGYRNSIFKNELKGLYIITSVDFMLHKEGDINVEYGNIRNYLEQNGITTPSLQQFHDAICTIRDAKLPDVKTIGNAGSFFKNPLITAEEFSRVSAKYPGAPHYPDANGMEKVPAGWLIEKTGWKGWRDEHVGVYEKQALVLVHYGGGSGSDIVALAQRIQDSVFEKFGIIITPEVNFVEP